MSELADVPVLGFLSRKDQRRLMPMVEWVDVPEGGVVAVAGQTVRWVVFVVEGALVADGHHEPVRAGGVFGATEAVLHETAPATMRAAVRSTVVMMERRRFTGALSTVPDFANRILRLVAAATTRSDPRRRARRFESRPTKDFAWAS